MDVSARLGEAVENRSQTKSPFKRKEVLPAGMAFLRKDN